jgi:hypothetical protein
MFPAKRYAKRYLQRRWAETMSFGHWSARGVKRAQVRCAHKKRSEERLVEIGLKAK